MSKNKQPSDEDLPKAFWDTIDAAGRDLAALRPLLHRMSREELLSFYHAYRQAAEALTDPEYTDHMGEDEDLIDDISRWVVAQGRDYYRDVLEHPEKTPSSLPRGPNAHFYPEILEIFYERF